MSGNNIIVRKILFMVGCIVFAMVFAVTTKTIIEYKSSTFDKEKPLGAAVTQTCDAGYWYSASLQDCVKCPAGKYCDGSGSSTACAAGYYQDELGQSSCKVCPSGTYQDSTGQTSCKECNGVINADRTGCSTSIEISCSKTIYVGSTGKCTVKYGNNDVTTTASYNSSQSAVATIDGTTGIVTAKKIGKTVISTSYNGATATATINVVKKISEPVCKTGLSYTGLEQQLISDGEGYTLSGHMQTNAGSHQVVVSLKDGYAWSSGSTSDKNIICSIAKVTPSIAVVGRSEKIYDGNPLVPKIEISVGDNVISSGTTAKYYNGGTCSGEVLTTGAPTEIGVYSIIATATINENFKEQVSTACTKIEIKKSQLNLACPSTVELGKTGKCTATFNGKEITDSVGTLTWSGAEGLNVDPTTGSFNAKAIGNLRVMASLKTADGTHAGYAFINVISANSFYINCGSGVLEKDETATCIAKFNGNNVIPTNYSSSDSKIVKVDSNSGVITAVASGKATISATYTFEQKEYTAKFDVSVGTTDYQISPSRRKIYLAKSDDTVMLDINIYNDNGTTVRQMAITASSQNGYVNLSTTPANYSGNYYPLVITSNGKAGGENKNTVHDVVQVCVKGTNTCTNVDVYIHCSKWTEINSKKTFSTGWLLSNAHVTSGRCDYMDPSLCKRIENSDGTVTYECSKYYNRCCGATSGGSTPTTETPACYSNNSTGIYAWGTYKNNSNYALVSTIKNETDCKTPTPSKDEPSGSGDEEVYACYKDNENNYEWSSSPTPGYTLVESIKDKDNCKIIDDAACYYDENGKYRWGSYSNNPLYTLVDTVKTADKCNTPQACYRDTNGDFVWGDYAYNSAYSLVTNITNQNDCGEIINVPSTGANKAAIIYISVIVMLIAGGSFVYIVYNKKRFN